MKKFSKGLLLFAAATAALTSCSDESPWNGSDTEGGINLNFSSDGRVMRQTRADDSMSPVVPDGSLFGVALSKSDGSYRKNWSSVDAFNREKSFPIGDYTLTASYGDIDVEGFNNPYYKGETTVHVSPGATTDANVTATLANAMVSIRYTSEFCENFPAYSASVQTPGHDFVMFAQNENRPAYIAPAEEVKLQLTLTNQNDQKQTITPASFQALPRHHYVVTIGVSGGSAKGDLFLDVEFDDDVVAETVDVNLGDELFTAPAPTVTAKGFNPDVTIEAFEGAGVDDAVAPEFHVVAFGGIKSATLNVISNAYTPLFGRSVELVNADPMTQSQLANEGIECGGFYRNVDRMGVVNFTKFFENLPAGDYTVQLIVVDALTRTSEPAELTARINAVETEFAAAGQLAFMADEVAVNMSTNCESIKDKVTFKVPDANNRMVDAEIKSMTKVDGTRAALPYTYTYVLALQPQVRSEINIEAYVGGKSTPVVTSVTMAAPEYTVTPDAFARKVVLKFEAATPAETEAIVNKALFYDGNTQIPTARVSYDAANGFATISGLNPGQTYLTLKVRVGSFEKDIPAFTTETEDDVPNGSFAAVTETIHIDKIQTGGLFNVKVLGFGADYDMFSSIIRSTPNDWANVNALTCNLSSSNMNTWYVVPSTYSENGAVVVRSVGYSHNGATIPTSGGSMNTHYYCENSPTQDQLDKAAGELFLGSYSLNSRTDGREWSTRPSSLTFDYSYAPVNNENAEAYVRILSASGQVLSEQTVYLVSSPNMINKTLSLSGYPFGEKAAKIELGFKSTKSGVTPTIIIPTGTDLYEPEVGGATGTNSYRDDPVITANQYKAVAVGSRLTVDNVRLGYEANSAQNNKPARGAKR